MSSLESVEASAPLLAACLRSAKARGRLAHAYLVTGDDEALRSDFSFWLCAMAACPSPRPPCLRCHSCDTVARGVHQELHIVEPASKSRQIRVGSREEPGTLRWLQGQFSLSSALAGARKMGVILDADCLNPSAQNAFLKTLEEPPPNSLMVLATGSPGGLLPTIRSRCHQAILISNRVRYEFAGAPALFQTLWRLATCGAEDVIAAAAAAASMAGLADGLEREAAAKAASKWAGRLKEAKESESAAFRKRVEGCFEAACKSEYLRLRAQFVGAVRDWFGQLFQIESGLLPSEVANPEIMADVSLEAMPSSERVRAGLAAAEKLNHYLGSFNVNEELAIYDFCFATACAPA